MQKKRFQVTTDSRHNYPVAPILLDRQFQVEAPNRVWASDFNYLWTKEGWLYLAVVIDLFSRMVVVWSLSKRRRLHSCLGYVSPAKYDKSAEVA